MQREHHPKNLKTVPAGNQNSLIKKASAQSRAKALKIMRFLGLVASQGGLFHLPENTFLKKVLQKRLNTKIFISDKPEVAVVKVMLILRYYCFELCHSFFSLCVSIQNIE